MREGLGEWLVGEVKVARGAWSHPKMFIVSDFLPSWQIRESFFLTFRLFFSLYKKLKIVSQPTFTRLLPEEIEKTNIFGEWPGGRRLG